MRQLTQVLGKVLGERLAFLVPPVSSTEEFLLRDSDQLAQHLSVPLHEVERFKQRVSTILAFGSEAEGPDTANGGPWSRFTSAIPTAAQVRAVKAESHIPTGLSDLNQLLGGGWPRGQLIAVVGEGQSGKTQVALHTAVACAVQGRSVLYVDTNNHLPLRRLHSLMNYFLLERQLEHPVASAEERAELLARGLDLVAVERAFDLFALLDLLCRVIDSRRTYDVVVVDCLHHLLAPLMTESCSANERFSPQQSTVGPALLAFNGAANVQPYLAQCLVLLRALATGNAKTTVVVTNVVHCGGGGAGGGGGGGGSSGSGVAVGAKRAHSTIQPCAAATVNSLAVTGGGAVFADAFDAVVLLSATRAAPAAAAEETLIKAEALLRPPFFNSCPEQVLVKLRKLAQ